MSSTNPQSTAGNSARASNHETALSNKKTWEAITRGAIYNFTRAAVILKKDIHEVTFEDLISVVYAREVAGHRLSAKRSSTDIEKAKCNQLAEETVAKLSSFHDAPDTVKRRLANWQCGGKETLEEFKETSRTGVVRDIINSCNKSQRGTRKAPKRGARETAEDEGDRADGQLRTNRGADSAIEAAGPSTTQAESASTKRRKVGDSA